MPLHIRVGLNSGEVVVRSLGNDLHMDYTVVPDHASGRADGIEGYVVARLLGPRPGEGAREHLITATLYHEMDVRCSWERVEAEQNKFKG